MRRYATTLARAAIVILTVAAVWEAAIRLELINPIFTSSPSGLVSGAVRLFGDPSFWTEDVPASATEFGLGFLLSVPAGVAVGLAAGWYRVVGHAVNPFLSALYSTPRVALLPLLIVWFGIGLWSKVALVFLGAFFPIAMNVMTAVRVVDPSLIRVATSFGAGDGRILRSIVLPSSVPFVLTGIRLGIGRALIGVIVAEFFVSTAGIGHIIAVAGISRQTDLVILGVLLVAGSGAVMMHLVRRLEDRFSRWRPSVAW